MKKLLFLLIYLFVAACTQPAGQKLPEIVKFEKPVVPSLEEFMGQIELIPLDHQNQIVIGPRPYVVHRDSCFYLADLHGTQKIYRFSEKGKFLDSIGKQGRGANEYTHMLDFYVSETSNEIYIHSSPDIRLFHYDKQGNYIGMKTLEDNANSFTIIKDHCWLNSGYNNGFHPEQVLLADMNLQLLGKYLPLETKIIHASLGPAFYAGEDHTYLLMPLRPTVYEVTYDTIFPAFEFDFGELNVPESFWKSTKPYVAFDNLCNKGFINQENIYESKDYIIAEFYSQKGQENVERDYFCGIKNKKTNTWQWLKKPESTVQSTDWYAGKIKGFTKAGQLMIFLPAYQLEWLSSNTRKLMVNPEILEHVNPDLDMFMLICSLK